MKVIHTYNLRKNVVEYQTDSYEFVPNGKFQWFKKWIWNFLHKTGCLKQFFGKEEKYERIVIDDVDLANKLFKMYMSFKSYHYSVPSCVYMGTEDFEEICNCNLNIVGFETSIKLNINYKVFNVPVKIIPHMKGVLFV